MQRIALNLTYNGQAYFGWQRQPNKPTVQGMLEKAIFALSNEWVDVACAGRTDKGVHALNQVAHFDVQKEREPSVWVNALNAHLPSDIRVLKAQVASKDFHARFSAVARHYQYFVFSRRIGSPIFADIVARYPYELDLSLMQQGAQYFMGEHDFSAFRGPHCQAKSPVRTVLAMRIEQKNDLFVFDVKANALHHMVRNMVGSLFAVGRKQYSPDWIQTLLACKDRKQAGMMAPAQGLYFVDVDYQQSFETMDLAQQHSVSQIWQFQANYSKQL